MKLRILTLCVLVLVASACSKKAEIPSTLEITELVSPADSSSAEPYLFADDNGNVCLSWIGQPDDSSLLMFSQWNGSKWGAAQTIAAGRDWFVNWADYPAIAMHSNGKGVAHYLQKSAASTYAYDIKLSHTADGGNTWSPAVTLHDDSTQTEHGFASISLYQDGFFISWLDGRNTMSGEHGHDSHDDHGNGGAMTLRGALLSSSGDKQDEWLLDDKVCDCCQTSSAITANGPIVVYRDRGDGEVRDISIVRLVSGEWTTPQSIYQDQWMINACPVNGPRAAARDSILAVAWYSESNSVSHVKVVFSQDAGRSFAEPITVGTAKAMGRVDILLLDKESALVSWMEEGNVMASRVYKDGTASEPTHLVATTSSRSSGFPQIARAGDDILIAWTDATSRKVRTAMVRIP